MHQVGAQRIELCSPRLKAGCFAKKLYPHGQWGMRFKRIRVSISLRLFSVSGRPEYRTQRGSVISRTWAKQPSTTDYGLSFRTIVRALGHQPCAARSLDVKGRAPRGRAAHLSGNGAPHSKPGVLPTAPLPDRVSFVLTERSASNPAYRPIGPNRSISNSPNWRDDQTSLALMSAARMGIEPISPP